MPSAKAARQAEQRRGRNRTFRTGTRTLVSNAVALIQAGNLEEAGRAVKAAVVALDRLVQKGVVHPNNAARRKSRIMARLNSARQAKG